MKMSTENENLPTETAARSPISNPFLMFCIGAVAGTFTAWVPLSIAVYSNQTGYHLSHYLVLVAFAIVFGWLAVVQKEKFADTLSRVWNSMTFG